MFDPAQPPEGPFDLLYDEECGVCRAAIRGILKLAPRGRLKPVGLRTERAVALFPDRSEEERLASFHLVSPTGERWSGPEAVSHLLDEIPSLRPAGRLLRGTPALQHATASAYGWVARNRGRLSRFLPEGWKDPVEDGAGEERRPGYHERPGGFEEG
jgi:predicted DCC family thiol-disulfide oxidoreductase YuxK